MANLQNRLNKLQMRTAAQLTKIGCLASMAAPLLGILLYPKANWLFAFLLLGFAMLVVVNLFTKDRTPQELADEIEQLLNGTYDGWAVDDYEHHDVRDPEVRRLWQETMEIGGLPEEWVRLDRDKQNELQEIVRSLRDMQPKRGR